MIKERKEIKLRVYHMIEGICVFMYTVWVV